MKHIKWVAALAMGLSALVGAAEQSEVILEKPVSVMAVGRAGSSMEPVVGKLMRYDADTLLIKTKEADQKLNWADLSPGNAYAIRLKAMDQNKPENWLDLGAFALRMGAKDQAKTALATAVKMDASLKPKADAILGGKASVPKPNTSKSDTSKSNPSKSDTSKSDTSKSDTPADDGKYTRPTAQQNSDAIAAAKEMAREVGKSLKLNLAEVETDHFLIFTDWNRREFGFLKENLEGAYTEVARQFGISSKENVFIGKLPVYMIVEQSDFQRFSLDIDHFPTTKTCAGYYTGYSNGMGHMAMWKPVAKECGLQEAKRNWATVLTHEFTHAFVARYHGNRHIPTWFNEGIAETISLQKFPHPYRMTYAKQAGKELKSLNDIFIGDSPKRPEAYPVMWTLVQTLIARDKKAFLAMYDSMKEGMEPEEALKKHFKWDYEKLTAVWREYVKRAR